jgi:response regulator RpfG family c-di-GMP phosphodiesterase
VASLVEHHHDRYEASADDPDPDMRQLLGVLGVADAVVAMRSERAHAHRRTHAEALAELRSERARQFHPEAVDAMQFLDRPAELERVAP